MNPRKNPISLNQVIDLIRAGPTMAAKMGQYPQIWERMPDLCAELETIASKLEALGIDGWEVLRNQPRLWEVFNYYDRWKDTQTHGQDTSGRPLCFTIIGSPMLKQAGVMTKIMKQMIRKNRKIELRLKDGMLRGACGGLAFSIPAQHEEEGTLMVHRLFLKILLDALTRDESIKCRLDENVYLINGATYTPPTP